MNVLIVLAHPERASFNGGLAEVAKQSLQFAGHTVELDDLYQEGFEFRDQLEQNKTVWADRLPGLFNESSIPFTGWEDWDQNGVLEQTHPLRWRP